MQTKRLLVHGVFYTLLAVTAFLVGRLSVKEREPNEISSVQVRQSILTSPAAKGNTLPHPTEPSQASSGTLQKSVSEDDFVEKLAELVGADRRDYSQLTQIAEAWMDKDPLGAIDFLTRGTHGDNMLQWLVSLWSRKHPEDASGWLADNRDMAGFDYAVEGLSYGIEKEDPASALKWAQMIEDPEIKIRVWASTGYEQFRQDHELAATALADSGLPSLAQQSLHESWTTKWKNTAKRNAQNISSVLSAAEAAGATFEASSAEGLVEQIIKGTFIDHGAFKGEFFGVPNLSDREAAAAREYLVLHGDVLAYRPGED